MAASVCEQILARVNALLLDADIVGSAVHRNRRDPFSGEELPAINIKRGELDVTPHARNVDRNRFGFAVACVVAGADVETAADALHVACSQALFAEGAFAGLGVGLQLVAADNEPDEADVDVYRLTARYEIQFLTRPGDPTRPLK